MSDEPPAKRARTQRSPAELALLTLEATASPFISERWPESLMMAIGLLSHGHRDSLAETKRECSTMAVRDIVQSVERLEDARLVAPSLGLSWPPPGVCEAAAVAGRPDQYHLSILSSYTVQNLLFP